MRMLLPLIYKAERGLAYLQGKGWGAGTAAKEVSQLLSLMGPERSGLYIDIGGHVGAYSEQLLAHSRSAEIVIFEPSVINQKRLKEKFAGCAVTIEPSAVSDKTGKTTLHSNEAGSSLASLNKRDLSHVGLSFEKEERVRSIRFDEFWVNQLNRRPIDACKIDVEGHELSVLEGMGEAVINISVIQFEFGGTNVDSRTFFRDFWNFFQRHGFDIYRMTPFGPNRVFRYRESEESFAISNYVARNRRLDEAVS